MQANAPRLDEGFDDGLDDLGLDQKSANDAGGKTPEGLTDKINELLHDLLGKGRKISWEFQVDTIVFECECVSVESADLAQRQIAAVDPSVQQYRINSNKTIIFQRNINSDERAFLEGKQNINGRSFLAEREATPLPDPRNSLLRERGDVQRVIEGMNPSTVGDIILDV